MGGAETMKIYIGWNGTTLLQWSRTVGGAETLSGGNKIFELRTLQWSRTVGGAETHLDR